ncbi:hypothetical protein TNCT_112551 [Trichonephila clavata]|uniref:Uncharacterized protein n=1 Tax=Trichonephila clavata TaxID=2740835 RepID=A0A8X6G0E1_TRICU|nr:hypothetical protein TNCT_112551 [Trichonephila clavata]
MDGNENSETGIKGKNQELLKAKRFHRGPKTVAQGSAYIISYPNLPVKYKNMKRVQLLGICLTDNCYEILGNSKNLLECIPGTHSAIGVDSHATAAYLSGG